MKNSNNQQPHPIQLKEIAVSKLSIIINNHEKSIDYQGAVSMRMALGTSGFSVKERHISVGLRVKVEPVPADDTSAVESLKDSEKLIFSLEVELQGHFVVDLDKFHQKHIEPWSKINAPFLLFPYVREHVYGLANRAGMRGLILPLFIQPGTEKNFTDNL